MAERYGQTAEIFEQLANHLTGTFEFNEHKTRSADRALITIAVSATVNADLAKVLANVVLASLRSQNLYLVKGDPVAAMDAALNGIQGDVEVAIDDAQLKFKRAMEGE